MTSPSTDRRFGLNSGMAVKVPCRVATTANITLSGEQTIDGVLTAASRVLVKDQTDTTENGIYDTDSGAWVRSPDFDSTRDVVTGTFVYVTGGTVGLGFWYILTTGDPSPGDAMTFGRASSVLAAMSPYIQTLVDDLTAAAARTTLSASSLGANVIINGGCAIAQRSNSTVSLATGVNFGQVDLFQTNASGGVVGAGTIEQNTASGIGQTGYSIKVAGVTLTGSGQLTIRHHIESRDALALKNLVVSFGCKVSHDVGSAINYTVKINRPTLTDIYGTVVNISTSTPLSVATGISSATDLKFENVTLDDCSKGLEILVIIDCGAVTTKNFEVTELQLAMGVTAAAFEFKPFGSELTRVQRYHRRRISTGANSIGMAGYGYTNNAQQNFQDPFPVEMKAAPTATISASSDFYLLANASTAVATGLTMAKADKLGALWITGTTSFAVNTPASLTAATTAAWIDYSAEF